MLIAIFFNSRLKPYICNSSNSQWHKLRPWFFFPFACWWTQTPFHPFFWLYNFNIALYVSIMYSSLANLERSFIWPNLSCLKNRQSSYLNWLVCVDFFLPILLCTCPLAVDSSRPSSYYFQQTWAIPMQRRTFPLPSNIQSHPPLLEIFCLLQDFSAESRQHLL